MEAIEIREEPSNAESLAGEWVKLKHAEEALRAERTRIEDLLERQLPVPRDGSKTITVGPYKCRVVARVNYSLDLERWAKAAGWIPHHLQPVREKLEVHEPTLKRLHTERPDLYQIASEAITARPGKLGWTVEEVAQ